ncbi:potassium-transporting ATPase subunit A [Skermanella stibiiresistens SB22]|uniref:Potassium-transporting ATPase subunit A n=1 Tax=Skermanella stibiiresistens SB22 TaxID=1385369 RepID=W9HBD7_9PROT|nr:potassium ABC transporter ATPase [Skermanella stibiiresistens]EWY41163.1 potassium-transporting ATPase subunit A [Skermanella stibiiresistens SB22]
MTIADVQSRLVTAIDRHPDLVIAVSGGVDSMTLAHVAHRFSASSVAMLHAVSPAVPPHATARVRAHAEREGWALTVSDAGEFADPRYRANPVDRCYFCKSNLYDRIRAVTDGTVASGTNLDDLGDYRPGLKAAAQRGVVHPFVEAGIDKATVRALARLHGLDDLAELPAQPCLSSRVETGIAIDADDLAFVDRVETAVAALMPAGASVRCRITHGGVALELGETPAGFGEAERLTAGLCAETGRIFSGVRPYRRGSAFLRTTP